MTKNKDNFEPEPFFPKGHTRAGSPRCQARSRSGEQCKKSPIVSKRVCKNHGGKSPSGPASAAYKHGRYVGMSAARKALPHAEAITKSKYGVAFERYQAETENLSLADDIDLNLAMITGAIEAVDSSITPEFLDLIEVEIENIIKAMSVNDRKGLASGVIAIKEMIAQARKDQLGERRLERLQNQRLAMVDKQTRMIERSEKHLPAQMVVSLILKMADNFSRAVDTHADPAIANAIIAYVGLTVRDAMIFLGSDSVIEGESTDDS